MAKEIGHNKWNHCRRWLGQWVKLGLWLWMSTFLSLHYDCQFYGFLRFGKDFNSLRSKLHAPVPNPNFHYHGSGITTSTRNGMGKGFISVICTKEEDIKNRFIAFSRRSVLSPKGKCSSLRQCVLLNKLQRSTVISKWPIQTRSMEWCTQYQPFSPIYVFVLVRGRKSIDRCGLER